MAQCTGLGPDRAGFRMVRESRTERSIYSGDWKQVHKSIAVAGLVHIYKELGDGGGRYQRAAGQAGAIRKPVVVLRNADLSQEIPHLSQPGIAAAEMPRHRSHLAQHDFGMQVLA